MATTKSELIMALSSGRVREKNENEGPPALDAAPGKKAFPFVRDGSETNRHSYAGRNDRKKLWRIKAVDPFKVKNRARIGALRVTKRTAEVEIPLPPFGCMDSFHLSIK